MKRRLAAAAAALAMSAVPAAAEAQVHADGQVGPVSASATVDLSQIFTGGYQLLDPLSGLTCPILGQVGCVVKALDFQFATRLRTANGGEIRRKQLGIVGVPTLLNVDNDILPDVTATLRVHNLGKFELIVERFLGETSQLPLQIEALVDEPLPGLLPRRHINLGYDARTARAPQKWSSIATLPAAPAGTTIIDMTTSSTSPGHEITTLAGLYNGSADARTQPMGGRLRYAPVPGVAKLGLTLGPKMEVRAGANRAVALDAQAELVEGSRRQDVDATVNPLPGELAVSFEEPGAERRRVDYRASAPVQDVEATYVDSANGVTGTKVVAEAHGLPTGMTVEQTSARSGTFTATGGDLRSVEVGFANGEPRLLAEDNPYAHVVEDGDLQSFAGRIDGLRSATVDATEGVAAGLRLGPDARKKLHGVVDFGGLEVDATISDLPRSIDFAFVPSTGAIDYDAHGETIQKITAKATSDEPLLDRATRVEGVITGLPPKADVRATPGADGFSLATDQAIGHADVLLSSGPHGGLQPGEVGADVVDTAAAFVAHARVNGLRKVEVALGKDAEGGVSAIDGRLQLASEPTVVRYDGKDLDLDASLTAIPDDVTLAFDKAAGSLTYDASGPIAGIDARVTSATPLVDRAVKLDTHVEGIPAHAEVNLRPADGREGLTLSTDAPVGHAEVLLTSGPDGGLQPGETGADVVDTDAAFVAHARVDGLRRVDVGLGKDAATGELRTIGAKLEIASKPTVVRYDSTDLDLDAGLTAVPGDVDLTFDKDAGTLTYDADAGIGGIDATVEATEPLFDQARKVEAHVAGLPKEVTLGFKPESGADGASFTTDARIGMVEAAITDGTTPAPALPAGATKVVLRKLPGTFAVAARLFEVREGTVELHEGGRVEAELELGTLPDGSLQDVDLDVQADVPGDAVAAPLDLVAHVEDLPAELKLDLTETMLDYTASGPITRLDADVHHLPQGVPGEDLTGRPQHVRATIHEVPARLQVFLQDIEVRPQGRLGRVDFELWDTGAARPALPEDGRNKLDFSKRDGGLHVQGRLNAGLTHAKLELPREPAGPTTSRTRVTTAFDADPAPLDVDMAAGTSEDPSDIDIVVDDLRTSQQFTLTDYNGLYVDWRTNEPGTDVDLDVSTKDIGTDLNLRDLPTVASFCLGGDQQCVSDVRRTFRVNDKNVTVPTQAAIHSSANGLVQVNGWVCLPPTDKESDRVGDVYGTCADRTATNRLELDELWLQNTALGFFSGETVERNEDGDGPEEDELLKFYLLSDSTGVRVRNMFVRNTVADNRIKIGAGWKDVDGERRPVGEVLRSSGGQAFELLADLSGIPNAESRRGQIQCDDVNVNVWILVGSFDVIPHLAETVLGDVCED